MKQIFAILFIFIVFMPTQAQNFKLFDRYTITSDSLYSKYSELTSFEDYSLYAKGYIGQFQNQKYGMTILFNETSYLLFMESLHEDQFKIIDILKVNREDNCYLQNMMCFLDEEIDCEIVALARIQKQEFQTEEFFVNIINSWRLNIKKKRIEIIDASNIKCYNEGYGV
ncbi:hypothetical protein GCQ56_02350 [Marinifilum sp. N1E240]|uniref:hypothetical protein n=1 Tax=Marinifilum sp. N1E240 TaxID=2608082 RepID=UPI00128E5D27|nr:hypothetical protein [Marinifilum sp. N1E240]MPQ45838.1 hypothetical protein [Marinifilum sp. N1E240]